MVIRYETTTREQISFSSEVLWRATVLKDDEIELKLTKGLEMLGKYRAYTPKTSALALELRITQGAYGRTSPHNADQPKQQGHS
jgi:hypothetical protein